MQGHGVLCPCVSLCGNHIRHFRTDSVKILCDKPTAINLDGELRTSDVVNISVAQEKVRFFYPKDLSWQAKDPAHC